MQKLRDEVYSMMNQLNKTEALVLRPDGDEPQEQKTFKLFQEKTPFGNGVKKMVDEIKDLKGKKIKER